MKNIRRRMTAGLATAVVLSAVAILLLPTRPGQTETDSIAEMVLQQQQVYFQRFISLAFEAETGLEFSPEGAKRLGLPSSTQTIHMRFVSSGPKYRSDVRVLAPGTERDLTMTRAYDGTLSQALYWAGTDRSMLSVSRRRRTENVYGTGHPLTELVGFVFSSGDEMSLVALQEGDKWSGLAERVVECNRTTFLDRDGVARDGIELSLELPSITGAGETSYTAFFRSDLDYLPVFWRAVRPNGTTHECRVVSTQTHDDVRGRMIIPTRLEFVAYLADGTPEHTGYMEIDPQSLVVNQPVDESVFAIPASAAAKHLDEDTGVLITP